MKESELIKKFEFELRRYFPSMFFYKIKDTLVLGGKKPFDGFFIIAGEPFCFEAKIKKRRLTKYQVVMLHKARKAGAICFKLTEDYKDVVHNVINYFSTDIQSHRKACRYFKHKRIAKRRRVNILHLEDIQNGGGEN